MTEFFKDLFGVNRYHVAWRYERHGDVFEGTTGERLWRCLGPSSKAHAAYVAYAMNRVYGKGSHWIVRAMK